MNVLVAHGDELLCIGIGRALESNLSDMKISKTVTFADCFARLTNDPPTDILVLDLWLPGFAHLDGLRSLRARWPDLPLIIVIERDNPGAARRALKSGATACLAPSDSANELLAIVAAALTGRSTAPSWAVAESATSDPVGRPRTISAHQMGSLTPRQLQVLDLVSEGQSNKQIAGELNVAEGTVRIHVAAILKTLNLRNRTQAALAAVRSGMTG